MAEMIVVSPDEVVAFLKAQHNLIETAEEVVVHPRVRHESDDGDELVVLNHAAREENDEFPVLQRELDTDDLKRMAAAVRAAEAIAPTRLHPGVESAKLNLAVGPFASTLDRARDLIGTALG